MTKKDWKTNDKEGKGLRRACDKLLNKLKDSNDPHEIADLSRALAYVATAKKGLTDSEDIKELREELVELKRLAGIAQKTELTK